MPGAQGDAARVPMAHRVRSAQLAANGRPTLRGGAGRGATDGEPRDHMGSKAVTRQGSDGPDAPRRGDAGKQGLTSPRRGRRSTLSRGFDARAGAFPRSSRGGARAPLRDDRHVRRRDACGPLERRRIDRDRRKLSQGGGIGLSSGGTAGLPTVEVRAPFEPTGSSLRSRHPKGRLERGAPLDATFRAPPERHMRYRATLRLTPFVLALFAAACSAASNESSSENGA